MPQENDPPLIEGGLPLFRIRAEDLKITASNRLARRILGGHYTHFNEIPFFHLMRNDARNYHTILHGIREGKAFLKKLTLPHREGSHQSALNHLINARHLCFHGRPTPHGYEVSIEDQTALQFHDRKFPAVFNAEHNKRIIQKLNNNKVPYVLVYTDIDNFGTINKKYDNEIGDRALSKYIQLTKTHLRKGDLFGRDGGDEFVFVFEVGEHYGDYADFREDVVDRLRSLATLLNDNPLQLSEGRIIRLSISVGIYLVCDFSKPLKAAAVLAEGSQRMNAEKARKKAYRKCLDRTVSFQQSRAQAL